MPVYSGWSWGLRLAARVCAPFAGAGARLRSAALAGGAFPASRGSRTAQAPSCRLSPRRPGASRAKPPSGPATPIFLWLKVKLRSSLTGKPGRACRQLRCLAQTQLRYRYRSRRAAPLRRGQRPARRRPRTSPRCTGAPRRGPQRTTGSRERSPNASAIQAGDLDANASLPRRRSRSLRFRAYHAPSAADPADRSDRANPRPRILAASPDGAVKELLRGELDACRPTLTFDIED
jgi:hypothetical protein